MGTNIEIKARCRFPDRMAQMARLLAGRPGRRMSQTDTFFHVPHGRLKLRQLPSGTAELIFYRRNSHRAPRCSRYWITPIHDPKSLRRLLAATLGIRGVVRKTRRLFLVGQTRIHLDHVLGLGDFVELEVVMRPRQHRIKGVRTAQALMHELSIEPSDLLRDAYIDMQERTRTIRRPRRLRR